MAQRRRQRDRAGPRGLAAQPGPCRGGREAPRGEQKGSPDPRLGQGRRRGRGGGGRGDEPLHGRKRTRRRLEGEGRGREGRTGGGWNGLRAQQAAAQLVSVGLGEDAAGQRWRLGNGNPSQSQQRGSLDTARRLRWLGLGRWAGAAGGVEVAASRADVQSETWWRCGAVRRARLLLLDRRGALLTTTGVDVTLLSKKKM